jgi:hypothetical protein
MNMEKEIQQQIENIIDLIQCPKGFTCYKSGLKNLCKVKDIGLESFLICLEKYPSECKFSIHYGEVNFCQCLLRVYIAKKFKK